MVQGVRDVPEIIESHNTKLNLLKSGADPEVIGSIDQGYLASEFTHLDGTRPLSEVSS